MIYIRPEEAIHASYLNRLLIEIADNSVLQSSLYFKGGTCAAMLGFLDRFSVDLDFDIASTMNEQMIRDELAKVFDFHSFTVVKNNPKALEFVLQYPQDQGKRHHLKLSALNTHVKATTYASQYLSDNDRVMTCQTLDSLFANKLVAVTDRYAKHRSIAGRDIYDIHHFFLQKYPYNKEVIVERTGLSVEEYFGSLKEFIQTHVTTTIIDEDLNMLLPEKKFQQIRKILIPETLRILSAEIDRLHQKS